MEFGDSSPSSPPMIKGSPATNTGCMGPVLVLCLVATHTQIDAPVSVGGTVSQVEVGDAEPRREEIQSEACKLAVSCFVNTDEQNSDQIILRSCCLCVPGYGER